MPTYSQEMDYFGDLETFISNIKGQTAHIQSTFRPSCLTMCDLNKYYVTRPNKGKYCRKINKNGKYGSILYQISAFLGETSTTLESTCASLSRAFSRLR